LLGSVPDGIVEVASPETGTPRPEMDKAGPALRCSAAALAGHRRGRIMGAGEGFDVVPAGGGAAGCVVAARLAAAGSRSVLLLEAGPDLRVSLPDQLRDGWRTSGDFDWGYRSEPDGRGEVGAAGGDPAVINQWIAEVTQQQRHAQRTLDQLRAAIAGQHQVIDPGIVRALLEELGDLAAGLDLADTPAARGLLPGDGHQRPVPAGQPDRADHGRTRHASA
jgi:GMC oxidoreductase